MSNGVESSAAEFESMRPVTFSLIVLVLIRMKNPMALQQTR